MAAAWLLTVLALGGVAAGALIGQVRALASQLAAAGGGLLTAVAVFWLVPEIAQTSGWPVAVVLAIAACGAMLLLDRFLAHSGHELHKGFLAPLLAAAAIHSFLDGWSVRVFAGRGVTAVAVPLGLGMHKVPEGAALGWVTRRSLGSAQKAMVASAAAESMTLAGAFLEPYANQSGQSELGAGWTAGVLAVIAGSFLFLGCHALWPEWRRPRVLLVFLGTLAAVGLLKR
ncbi:MAG: hypothetical protein JO211_07045 [Acidobacteriaceae bacterium]|nr:hypothetical protein [Acidobacteriaceae bacterium]